MIDKIISSKSVTDAEGRVVKFEYDSMGKVRKQILPDLREIEFIYDANGNVKSITPPGRPKHEFAYNAVDLEDKYTPPVESGTGLNITEFEYNLDKQPTKITRPDEKSINFHYEDEQQGVEGARLHYFNVLDTDGTTELQRTTFAYNATSGNLDSINAPDDEKLEFSYDGSLPLSTTWSRNSFIVGSVSRKYDNSFRIVERTVSDTATSKEVARFGYDNDDLLTSAQYDPDGIAGNGDEIELGLVYDTLGEIANSTANGLLESTSINGNLLQPNDKVEDSYLYNGFGELQVYTATTDFASVSTEVLKVEFKDTVNNVGGRDKLGRIKWKRETVNGGTPVVYEYVYDDAGRLDIVKKDGVVVNNYGYDDNSNRTSVQVDVNGDPIPNATHDNQDRLLTYEGNSYTYTANGELATKTNTSGTTSYTYDELGNLRNVDLPSPLQDIEYIIDGRNRRIGKKVGGTLEQQWLYKDQLNPIAELDGSGNITKRFIYASRANVPDVLVDVSGANHVVYRIIVDHLGSPRFIINTSTGVTVLSIEYDEWGNEKNVQFGTGITRDLIPFGFAGGLYDEDTKLVRFGARDYDPETGRWTSKDPIRFEGGDTNIYGYVSQAPIDKFDPSGQFGVAGAGIGFIVDVGLQLATNGGKFDCVNWAQAGFSGLAGAIGGAWFGNTLKLSKGSMKWKNVSRRVSRLNDIPSGNEIHHWAIQRNSAIGKYIPDLIKNHPLNLNSLPRGVHQRIHGNHPSLPRYGPIARWWNGTPGWAKAGQASVTGGSVAEYGVGGGG